MMSSTGTRWSELGALTSAGTLAATVLCCLPFATGIIGAGLYAIGARFTPLRPYFVICSLGLLGYSFYQAYRGEPSCAGDGCSPVVSMSRRRMTVWLAAAGVVALLTVNWWASWLIYWSL